MPQNGHQLKPNPISGSDSEKALGMPNARKSYDIQTKTQLGMPIRPIWAI
jgi:hypothetical protein